jgi:putative ABC transport system substrate-binding protein
MTSSLLAARMLRLACAITVVWLAMPTQADQPSGIPRIGVLLPPEAQFPLGDGLRESLRDLGYVEGKTISFEWRPQGGSDAELRAEASELARVRVDLVVVFTTPAARAVLDATRLPVVFMAGDPVTAGLVASLARPGGRATGVSVLTTDLSAKRLEFLRLAAPKAGRIAHLVTLANPNNQWQAEAAQQAGRKLGLQLVTLDVHKAGGVDAALSQLPGSGAGAVLVGAEVLFLANRVQIAGALTKARLPAIFPSTEYHEAEVLMSYGPNLKRATRRVAAFVDSILKGASPADLPVEQISEYELVINLRVARALGLQLPQDLMLRANEVIR